MSTQTGHAGALATHIPLPQPLLPGGAISTIAGPSTSAIAAADVLSAVETSSTSSSAQSMTGSKGRNVEPQLPNAGGVASAPFPIAAPSSTLSVDSISATGPPRNSWLGVPSPSPVVRGVSPSQSLPPASAPFLPIAVPSLESPGSELITVRLPTMEMSSVVNSKAAPPAVSSVIATSVHLSSAAMTASLAVPGVYLLLRQHLLSQ